LEEKGYYRVVSVGQLSLTAARTAGAAVVCKEDAGISNRKGNFISSTTHASARMSWLMTLGLMELIPLEKN